MITTIIMTDIASYHLTAEQIDSEEKLIKAAQDNPRNFEPLYKRYFQRIANYIYHRVEDKETAFELTSQVFYKALENLPKYKPMGVPFSAWLFRIAGNEINQLYRKNKVMRVLSIDRDGLGELKNDIDENNQIEIDKQLYEALQTLNEDDLELINMRFFEKRSFKEICEIMNMNESACKMKVYRILEKLKEQLKDIKL
ncbi:MAG TPA: sigma-70 family RNA polymerase sigma factor [Bacteroidia bacterium]|jgi:RNA polymerase sigma-70 factor (ECF subfamily)|nr:sigma-70 family RNA polymerase sigma factor [Bacteroidia bacterium]